MTMKKVQHTPQPAVKKSAKAAHKKSKAIEVDKVRAGLKAAKAARPYNFVPPLALYHANPIERIEMARRGLPAFFLRKTADILHTSQDRLNQKLNIPRSTIARKESDDKPLSQAQSERLIGVMMLIGQVEAIMADAGDESVEFDAGKWVSEWIEEPLPALGNRTAGEFMDTAEGQQLVSRVLAQSVAGAYV
jgi:putative toxin-antitoxin system antitoxin component (TIGR02293 family)